ncbi:acylphosphatase [Microvirga terricola]|uniref:Acylphosphatase n=1 Tax=Microvirga terricola TaxID=2719797 RepID=A0ABX0VFP2_9HYPH|nr:acylphosphatase [Microvirga terricola]NIX77795.1 acylphosphatase [Microvirga terricola]
MSAHRTLHVVIQGRVQGVGFRAWTQDQATLHGLSGWVRNRRDGSVEAVFSGPDALLQTMLRACEQGPRGAVVEQVDVRCSGDPPNAVGEGFQVLPTA